MINPASAKTGLTATKGPGVSGMVLIGANLIPLAGVLAWDWSIFHVVVVYWLENVIIGAINILKMVTCSPDPKQVRLKGKWLQKIRQRAAERGKDLSEEDVAELEKFDTMLKNHGGKLGLVHHASKLFLIPFFSFHYGLFCLVHGVFVFALLGKDEFGGGVMTSGGSFLGELSGLIHGALDAGGVWAAAGLLASHLFSFLTNYLGKGEYRRTAVPLLMAAPYGRIVVLHIAILFGAFATMALGSPVFLLVILIVGKILLDLKFHRRAHSKLAGTVGDARPQD